MFRFVLTRSLMIIPTLLGVIVLTFALIHAIPGDPILILLGDKVLDPEQHAAILHKLGLDAPWPVQLWDYLWRILHGDFGHSIATKEAVLKEFLTLFPATLELSFCAMAFALIIGLPAGIFAAQNRGTVFDHAVMGGSLIGYSMPIFWWGLLLILLFSIKLSWTPVSGRISLDYYFEDPTNFMLIDAWRSGEKGALVSALSHLILPTIVLGTIPLAVIARMTRSAMLEVLSEDYIRTARAKGLASLRIVSVHALRNALIPVVTVIGLQVGVLMGGAILTETIFSWPGIGRWLYNAIFSRDYPTVQGGVLLISIVVILVNLTVDLLYGLLNPRIRHGR